jgi:hypothetical protein
MKEQSEYLIVGLEWVAAVTACVVTHPIDRIQKFQLLFTMDNVRQATDPLSVAKFLGFKQLFAGLQQYVYTACLPSLQFIVVGSNDEYPEIFLPSPCEL